MIEKLKVVEIVTICAVTFALFLYMYQNYIKQAVLTAYRTKGGAKEQSRLKLVYLIFILLGLLIIKIVIAANFQGYKGDMACFRGWGEKMLNQGIASMYKAGDFTDYPPGYLYVLGFLAWIGKVFKITGETAVMVLYKLPACVCDIIAGYFIYRLAGKKFRDGIAVFLMILYVMNPSVLINSSVWGQVDGVYVLFLVMMIYFIIERKLPFAYLSFGIGFLMKPQMAIYTPILVWAIIEQVFLDGYKLKNFLINLFSGIGSIGIMFLLALPFGLDKVIAQYGNTVSSYPYCTVNAYNIWALFGLNWQPQTGKFLNIAYSQWGMLFIILSMAAAIYICYKNAKDDSKYAFAAAFLISGVFMFSVRMHERYLFPVLALLLIAFLMKPVKELFYCYIGMTAVLFLNEAHALYYYDPNNFNAKAFIPVMIALLTLIAVIYVIFTAFRWYHQNKEKQEERKEAVLNYYEEKKKNQKRFFGDIRPTQKDTKYNIWDFVILAAIVIIYALVAFHDVGDKEVPHTEYLKNEWNSTITLELNKARKPVKLAYYLGNYEGRKFDVEYASDINGPWTKGTTFEASSVFCWGNTTIAPSGKKYMRLTCTNNAVSLMELVLLDSDNTKVMPVNASDYKELFDEQDLYAERSKENSTYFDEIYHARTAFEFTKGRYSYENTHPPLGKAFIALGVKMFGMSPFGWRFMGIFFGVMMLPFLYMFGRKLFKSTWFAAALTILFAADFMHFTQTRISTIDVFVTFFIILMYYFMYVYTTKSFYDEKFHKLLIPLGLSGVSMGLGIASKWTGVYAGAGLGVLFFVDYFRRYMEYREAKKHPHGTTGEISHSTVIAEFPKKTKQLLIFCVLFFVLIPATIYTLSYLPFSNGMDMGLVARMLKNQKDMFDYHSKLVSEHPYSSVWYQWPIMYRPIYYYQRTISATVSEAISAFGNPLVWWAGIPAFFYMIYLTFKEKDRKALFLILAYVSQMLPWMLVSRTTYIYHYFTSVPFVALMLVYAMYKIVEKKPKMKYMVIVYVVLAVALFAFFYPVLSGQPIETQFVYKWMKWFDSWVLIS